MTKHGVFVGRLNPIHLGHEQVIDAMLEEYGHEHCTLIIGSSNAPTTMRHFFSYTERRNFIRQLYPTIQLVGVPDYPTDKEWLLALNDIIESITGDSKPGTLRFFGGADEDLHFFSDSGHEVVMLDRFDGTTPIISATEVRDRLVHGESLDELINPKIADDVSKLFRQRWEEFKKT